MVPLKPISTGHRIALGIGFFAMTLLAALLVWMRARLNFASSRLAAAEEAAAAAGIGETT